MPLSTDLDAPAAAAHAAAAGTALLRADLACILGRALAERAKGRGALTDLLGLDGVSLAALRDCWFAGLELPDLEAPLAPIPADQDAIGRLILWRGGRLDPEARWLAAIMARRSMEPHHLWEDMGLPSRAALNEMITRQFPRLKAANSQNMRWKKFFYRQICSDQGFALCLSPTCDACPERAECFPPS